MENVNPQKRMTKAMWMKQSVNFLFPLARCGAAASCTPHLLIA